MAPNLFKMRRNRTITLLLLTLVAALTAGMPGHAARQVLEPELAASLAADPDGRVSVVASFSDERARDEALGRFPGYRFASVPALAVTDSAERIRTLASSRGVTLVEQTGVIPVVLRTATTATRAKSVWSGPDPVIVEGDVIDGSGIGVAVVDTGISGTHPDLRDNMAANFKIATDRPANPLLRRVPPYQGPNDVFVPADETDTTSGHGTHVAGIVSGTGAASEGGIRGAAPGAALYGFSVGEGLSVVEWHALAAFDWIVTNHATQTPAIKVVNNSWGNMGDVRPDSVMSKLTTAMVDEGITVVWAAGNGDLTANGGDCSDDRTMSQSKHPGVISVAAYDDGGTGTRDGRLAGFSSRGNADDPTTWPDISAPGSRIVSALDPTGGVSWMFKGFDVLLGAFTLEPDPGSDAYNPYYVTLDGTSMAAPHVAGIVALALEANPALRPADVADILNGTAYRFAYGKPYVADPASATMLTSCDKGHGLADARSAVEAAIARR